MLRAVRAAAVVAATASLSGCLGGGTDRVGGEPRAPSRVLTMLDPFSNGDAVARFDEEVARLSHGALRIRVVDGSSTGTDFESATIRAMRAGRADLSFASSRAWDEFGVRRLRALQAPLLIDSYPLEQRVLQSELVGPMLEELRPLGLDGIGILPGAMRRPLGVRQRLAAPSDFRGQVIGTQQSRVADAALRALGARPRRRPARIASMAGLDGVERQIGSIEADQNDVAGSHLMTNVNLWPRALVVFAGRRAYRSLNGDQRRVLRAAAARVTASAAADYVQFEAESAGNLCRKGRTTFDAATPAELAALRRAVEPVYRELRGDPATRASIDAIERLKHELGEPPTEIPRCAAAPPKPSTSPTRIDGIWRMDTGPSAARPENFPENWGRWIFVFDRGSFAITQENDASCTWGYGKFAVAGNRTSWTFTDGGGIAPSGAMNRPGEYFVFDFSLFRDNLTLRPVEGEISPVNFRYKPWRRLSGSASRGYFSKRCPPPAAALHN